MESGVNMVETKRLASSTEGQISYLRNYKFNFENLKTEVEKLKDKRARIQNSVDEAKINGEEIQQNVQKWLERAREIIDEAARKISEDEETAKKRCFKGLCHLKMRYHLSKEAMKQLEAIVRCREAGSFDTISSLKDPRLSNKDFVYFKSRHRTLTDILSALSDPDVNRILIYGMGGIGKTMLAKEVALQVKRNKQFDRVVFVNVSRSTDIRKIQGELGDKLGLTLLKERESERASNLGKRLKKEKKILIILDNIWRNFRLSALGIPDQDNHKGCKVLLTSRSIDVLSGEMNTQLNFEVAILIDGECWGFFKKMAGEYIEGREVKPLATEVAARCAGLPIAIATVAMALKNKSLVEWKGALQELRSPSSENFEGIGSVLYSIIELSYNYLESGVLKKTFLLIGYANLTSFDNLLMCGMSLGLFEGINGMGERQVRVRRLVQHLKDACLLLGTSTNNEDFSMHDVVRDVAISIASRRHQVFTSELKWPDENTLKVYPSIILENINTQVLPRVLESQQLKLLSISAADSYSSLEIHDKFFTRMTELKGLALANIYLWSLPSSLCFLTNLQILGLFNCNQLDDIAIIGALKKLEILSFCGSDVKRLPVEVGQLTRLVSLDLRNCNQLKVIPPNVISRLSHLEELYIGRFSKWEVEELNKERRNASLGELKHLSKLTSLEIYIKDAKTIPKDLFFEKLEKYNISIGGLWGYHELPGMSRTFKLEISNNNICLNDGHIMQLKGIKDLYLAGLEMPSTSQQSRDKNILEDDVNVSDTLFNGKVALPKLETLELYQINVERIWQNQAVAMSCGIQNLTRLIISRCSNLRYLFSSFMVSSLARLQHLEICNCPDLEVIIVADDDGLRETEMKKVALPISNMNNYLKMKVEDCDKLLTLFPWNTLKNFLRLESLSVSHCRSLEVIFDLEGLNFEKTHGVVAQLVELNIVGLPKLRHVWNKDPANFLFFQKLNTLSIVECCKLKNVFPVSIASSLSQLKMLHISRCGVTEIVFVSEEGAKTIHRFVFPRVISLTLKNLSELKTFFPGKHTTEWPALKKLQLRGLDIVKILTSESNMGKIDLRSQQPNFLLEKVFPNFEELILRGKDIPIMTEQLPKDLLSKLKYLSVKFDEPTVTLSLDFLQRIRSKKILQIIGFSSNIRKYNNRIENGAVILNLNMCSNLKYIFKQEVDMDNLVQLQVLGCDNLIQLVESSSSFKNLTTLEIYYCKGLKKLVTSSTAKSLEQLRTMKVDSCSMLTEIMADEGDVAKDDEIVFSQMKELKLTYLESLTCFCSGKYTLKFPTLEELNVVKCPKMKFFSGGALSTPKLRRVKQEWFDKVGGWKGNLNATIQELHEEAKIQSSKKDSGHPSMQLVEQGYFSL